MPANSVFKCIRSARVHPFWVFFLLVGFCGCAHRGALRVTGSNGVARGSYVVVVSAETYAIPAWREVVDTLRRKYDGGAVVFANSVIESVTRVAGIDAPLRVFRRPPRGGEARVCGAGSSSDPGARRRSVHRSDLGDPFSATTKPWCIAWRPSFPKPLV